MFGTPLESTLGGLEAITLSFKGASEETACSEQVVELCDPLRFLPLLDFPAICTNLIPNTLIYKHIKSLEKFYGELVILQILYVYNRVLLILTII